MIKCIANAETTVETRMMTLPHKAQRASVWTRTIIAAFLVYPAASSSEAERECLFFGIEDLLRSLSW
jgi:hypothetical protein